MADTIALVSDAFSVIVVVCACIILWDIYREWRDGK